VDIPRPAPNQALLRVKSTTMCGTDEKIFGGLFPGTRFPHIPGHEFAGEVVELDPGWMRSRKATALGWRSRGVRTLRALPRGAVPAVPELRPDDKGHAHIGFTVPGGLADYVAIDTKALHKLPEELSWDAGAFCDNIGSPCTPSNGAS